MLLKTSSKQLKTYNKLLETWSKILETWSKLLETWSKILETWSKLLETCNKQLETWSKLLETLLFLVIIFLGENIAPVLQSLTNHWRNSKVIITTASLRNFGDEIVLPST